MIASTTRVYTIVFSFFIACVYAINAVQVTFLSIDLQLKGFSPEQIGTLLGIYFIGAIFGPIIINQFFSRLRYFKILMLGVFVGIIIMRSVLYLSHDFVEVALVLFFLAILYELLIPVSDLILLNCMPDSEHSYGKIRIFGAAGFLIVSSMLATFPNLMNINNPFALYVGVLIVVSFNILVIMAIPSRFFKTDMSDVHRYDQAQEANISSCSFREKLSYIPKHYWLLLLIMMSSTIANNSTGAFLILQVKQEYVFDRVSLVPAIAGVSTMIGFGIVSKFLKRYGAFFCLSISLLITAMRVGLLSIDIFPLVFVVQSFALFSFPMMKSSAVYIIKTKIPPSLRTTSINIMQSMLSSARLITSFLGGILLTKTSFSGLYFVYTFFPLFGLMLLIIFYRRMITKEQT